MTDVRKGQAPPALSREAFGERFRLQEEVRNAARALAHAVRELRQGRLSDSDAGLKPPRPK